MPSISSVKEYNDKYIEACFFAWYEAGHPKLRQTNGPQIMRILPPSPDGRKPALNTVKRWMLDFGWDMRADALDAEASLVLEREAVEKRVETLRQLADYGDKLSKMGMDFLEKNPNAFNDNVPSAIRAIIAGSEMVFKYAGAADRLAAINQMSDKQLEREITRLLGQDVSDDNDDENTVEGELQEMPEDEDTDNDDSR